MVHAQAQAEASAQAQQLAAKAHEHAAAQRHVAAQADHLKKVGVCGAEDATHQVLNSVNPVKLYFLVCCAEDALQQALIKHVYLGKIATNFLHERHSALSKAQVSP